MNISAANSLLKTLEEPVDGTILLLITSRASAIPATIRSRCQQVAFAPPDLGEGAAWLDGRCRSAEPELLLSLASGAPLAALQLDSEAVIGDRSRMLEGLFAVLGDAADPVSVAGRWSKQDPERTLTWMTGWLVDMIRLRTASQDAQLYNPDQRDRLYRAAKPLNLKRLHRLLDKFYQARRDIQGQINVQLMLEDLLLSWSRSGDGDDDDESVIITWTEH